MAPTSAHPGAAIDDVGEDGAYPRFVDTGVVYAASASVAV